MVGVIMGKGAGTIEQLQLMPPSYGNELLIIPLAVSYLGMRPQRRVGSIVTRPDALNKIQAFWLF